MVTFDRDVIKNFGCRGYISVAKDMPFPGNGNP